MRSLNYAEVRNIGAGATVNALDTGTGLLISRVPFPGYAHVGVQAAAGATVDFSLDINGRRVATARTARVPGATIPVSDPSQLDLVNIPIMPGDRGGQILFEVHNGGGAAVNVAWYFELSTAGISR